MVRGRDVWEWAGSIVEEYSPSDVASTVMEVVARNEGWRGRECINLLAPEAPLSPTARRLLSSELCQRAGEGEVGDRWFAGTKYVDELEALTVELAKKLFGCNFADQRLVSGMVANAVVYFAATKPGDVLMSIPKPYGGHSSNLDDGPAGMRGLRIQYIPFNADDMVIDVELLKEMIPLVKPDMIAIGQTLTLFPQPVKKLSDLAEDHGFKIYFDGAHQLGLMAGGAFPNPLGEGADFLTGSTGKTLSGPQGGIILWNKEEYTERLRWAIFPGLAATHQINRVAALAVSLAEMLEFGRDYMGQIVSNARALGKALDGLGFRVLCAHRGYTETQMIAVDVTRCGGGREAAQRLEEANIIVNKNLLPSDRPESWDNPSGIRLGVTEVTRLGMKEREMSRIAGLIHRVLLQNEDPGKIRREVVEFRSGFQRVHYCFDA
ncbi:MAG: serine hydroxymethyltransferase [Candidatus Geothermarchaeales archaeon]